MTEECLELVEKSCSRCFSLYAHRSLPGAPGGKGSESGSFKGMSDVDAAETRDAAIGIATHSDSTMGISGMARRREEETLFNGLPKTKTILEVSPRMSRSSSR